MLENDNQHAKLDKERPSSPHGDAQNYKKLEKSENSDSNVAQRTSSIVYLVPNG